MVEQRLSLPLFASAWLAWLAVAQAQAKPTPAHGDELAAQGRSLIRAGRLKEAEDALRQAAIDRGQSLDALYDLARVKFASGDYQKSRIACKALIEKDAQAALSNLCMARAFLVWRRATRAEEYVAKARESDPHRAEVFQVLGDLKRVEGDLNASKAAYQEVLRISPRDPDAQYGLGQLYLLMPDFEAAQRAFRAALGQEPTWPDALYELGKLSSGNEAIQLLQRAIAAKPNWPEARLALGAAELANGDIANAEALFREVLKSYPNHPMAHARLGMALEAKGDYTNAEIELKRGLAGLPNDPDAAIALARVFAKTDRPEDAFEQYRNTASLEHVGSRALVEAGTYALSLGRNTLAQGFLDKAIERTPKSAAAQARYADALVARGDKAKAKDHYRLALSGEGAIDRDDIQRRLDALK
ncbi:MAG TPA: tetratricopeptide repeat protein [Polyangiales bacterium]